MAVVLDVLVSKFVWVVGTSVRIWSDCGVINVGCFGGEACDPF